MYRQACATPRDSEDTASQPSIDPVATGFRFRVNGASGGELFSPSVPPGRASDPGTAGWSTNSAATRWTFRDRQHNTAGGISSVSIRRDPKIAGLFSFRVRAPRGDFAIPLGEVPVEVEVILGLAPGQCGSVVFHSADGVAPRCVIGAGGDHLDCR